MSSIAVPTNYNLPAIAKTAGATDFEYRAGELHANCSQDALDASLAAYDHTSYINKAKQKYFTASVQVHLDTEAAKRGYDSIFTAISYATSNHPTFGPEGVAYREWRDDVWTICHALLSDWLAGGDEPTIDEVLNSLPAPTLP